MSLQRRLLLGVAVVLLLVGAIAATIGGISVQREVRDMLDQNFIQIARLALNAPEGTPHLVPTDARDEHELREAELVVTRWNGGTVTNLLSRDVQFARPTQAGFGEALADRRSWKTYALQTADGWVLVAQATEAREELVQSAMLTAVLPILLGLPLIGVVIALLIRRTLAPVQQLAQSMEQRAPLSTEPLPDNDLPREMRPVVASFNHLLARVGTAVERERGFITDAAHALRTPITAVQLQAEALREAKSRNDFGERLNELIDGIARGRHTVEQLLTLARAEHANAGSALVIGQLPSLPERLAAALQRKALTLQLDGDVPPATRVPLHPHTLNIVLDNLLDNAIRYSPQGGVIDVGFAVVSGRLRVSVQDHGPGLPRHEIDQVFNRFYRPVNDATAGTGLGLAIVRGICEAAGGRAWLEQAERGGLIAFFELPASVE